ncbi:hypothetical protein [Ornithinimicrobium kibberense]|uniref:hypothetical protein n=1 Tax=Ornithinimicrobium kibberense TaxID=282060 RepID=UPI00360DCC29
MARPHVHPEVEGQGGHRPVRTDHDAQPVVERGRRDGVVERHGGATVRAARAPAGPGTDEGPDRVGPGLRRGGSGGRI